jgi:hypothetical protein
MNKSVANGGSGKGHFTKGNRGRPVGAKNKATVNLWEIRRCMADSWVDCNGAQLLRDLARDDPLNYLKLMVALMPKTIDATVDMGKLDIVVRTESGAVFAEELRRQVGVNGTLAPLQIVKAFRQSKRDMMELKKQGETNA